MIQGEIEGRASLLDYALTELDIGLLSNTEWLIAFDRVV